MNLVVNGKLITTPIYDIIKKVKSELHNGKLRDIVDKGANVLITCPFHKDGHESHPSCQVYADEAGDLRLGEFHCFTCKEKGSLEKLIEACFDEQVGFGAEWLDERFGDIFIYQQAYLPEINLNKKLKHYLDESILEEYKYIHPYMYKRRLTDTIIKKFTIGYDKKTDTIVFPVWDEHDKLVMLTRRSVTSKAFYIDKDVEKPVYLLNFLIKEKIKTAYITESQINALTCWAYGYPACALIGTGTQKQYQILSKCGIHHFVLCLDGDEAGDNGIKKLIENLPKDCIIDVKMLPRNKDVNDLDKNTFDNLPIIDAFDWITLYNKKTNK